uniref:Arrestin-like N-terminal domain-containing protein n=1 Tax=Labrus bergylta TaxID=56723 RepID=A0A3Q3GCB4_9LABR
MVQVIKNFNIHVNPLNARNTISTGDLLTGHISFELTKETNVTSITMAMKGKAHVHWSRGAGGKRRRRRNFSAKLEFFNLKGVILQDRSGKHTDAVYLHASFAKIINRHKKSLCLSSFFL